LIFNESCKLRVAGGAQTEWLFIFLLHEQKKNGNKKKIRRLAAPKLKFALFSLVEKGAGVGKKMPAGEFLLHRFLCSCKENDEPSGLRFYSPFLLCR